MSDTPRDTPEDVPNRNPDPGADPSVDRNRTPEQGGMTPADRNKAIATTAAAGAGCLTVAIIPYLTVIGAVVLLLVLGFFFKGGCAPAAPPGSPNDTSIDHAADPGAPAEPAPTPGPPGR